MLKELHCCSNFSLVAKSRGSSLVLVHRLLVVVTSLVEEHRLEGVWASVVVAHGLSCPEALGIFLDQGSNPCPLHLDYKESKPVNHKGNKH